MDERDRRTPADSEADDSNVGRNEDGNVERVDDGGAESVDPDIDPRVSDESDRGTPPDRFASPPEGSRSDESVWDRFWNAENGPLVFLREFAISVGIVLFIGLLLFGLSGVWPPMVAVESASMEPNINQYDLVIVTEPGRFAPAEADDRGIVTVEEAEASGHETFGRPGNVIVYAEPGSGGPPIIHRAHLFVEEGENWYDRADPDAIDADSCAELSNCPAPRTGYITKGDNEESNGRYDQVNGIAPIIEPDWMTGVARIRIPYLGWIRLAATGAASSGPLLPVGITALGGAGGYGVFRARRGRL